MTIDKTLKDMPELPEVETVKRGLAPHIENKKIRFTQIHHPNLRYPIVNLDHLHNQTIKQITRRNKYLIFEFASGNLLIHLGMSGILRLYDKPYPPKIKHDHVEIEFDDVILRYHDPRRFGAILWCDNAINEHPLIKNLGPEPLSDQFNLDYLSQRLKQTTRPIKTVLTDNNTVCGIGNIYANEILFQCKIHPKTPANTLNLDQQQQLITTAKLILTEAIKQGGTTLKDFKNAEGKPGYFAQKLKVYGKINTPCCICQQPIEKIIIGQRSTFYCPRCQPSLS